MDTFAGLTFPYSAEVKDLPRGCVPNLQLDNTHQSLYAVLKHVRTDLVGKKLREEGSLMFDRFINDVLGASVIKVAKLYPPENSDKLDKFLRVLKECDVDGVSFDAVMYYILKDFSFHAAERYIHGASDQSHSTISLRIPKCLYDLVNAIYFIDRFDIFRSLTYLNATDYSALPMSFVEHYVKVANLVPYHSEMELKDVADLSDMKAFVDSRSCRPSACSVVSSVRAFRVPVLQLDSDVQLLYVDALSDLNPLGVIKFLEEQVANYDVSLKISLEMLLRIVVSKLLVKTVKQQRALRELQDSGKLRQGQFESLFEHLAMFCLVDTKLDSRVDDVLSDVLFNIRSEEEKSLRTKFPHYFSRLDDQRPQMRRVARNLMAWKAALINDAERVAQISLVKLEGDTGADSLKLIAQHFL